MGIYTSISCLICTQGRAEVILWQSSFVLRKFYKRREPEKKCLVIPGWDVSGTNTTKDAFGETSVALNMNYWRSKFQLSFLISRLIFWNMQRHLNQILSIYFYYMKRKSKVIILYVHIIRLRRYFPRKLESAIGCCGSYWIIWLKLKNRKRKPTKILLNGLSCFIWKWCF